MKVLIGFGSSKPDKSVTSLDIQTATFEAEHDAIYSASHDGVAKIVWFLDRQEIGPPAMMNKYQIGLPGVSTVASAVFPIVLIIRTLNTFFRSRLVGF